jgi:hypothetical protein
MPSQKFVCDSSSSESRSSRSSNYCRCESCSQKRKYNHCSIKDNCCKYHKRSEKCKKNVDSCSDRESEEEKCKNKSNKCSDNNNDMIDYDICKKNGKVIVITIN